MLWGWLSRDTVAGVNLSVDIHRVPSCMRSTRLAKLQVLLSYMIFLTDFLNFLHECPRMRQEIMFQTPWSTSILLLFSGPWLPWRLLAACPSLSLLQVMTWLASPGHRMVELNHQQKEKEKEKVQNRTSDLDGK